MRLLKDLPCVQQSTRTVPGWHGPSFLCPRCLTGYRDRRPADSGLGRRQLHHREPWDLLRSRKIDLVDELLQEDRSSDLPLCDPVRAAGMDDSDVGDTDEAKDDPEVRRLSVVCLHGRAGVVLTAAGDDDGDLLAFAKAL